LTILLLRLRLIGDVVFTTPIVAALRRAYPQARISYLVEPAAAPIVAGNPLLDEVIVAPRRRGIRRAIDDLALARRYGVGGLTSCWICTADLGAPGWPGRAAPASGSATTFPDAGGCTRASPHARVS